MALSDRDPVGTTTLNLYDLRTGETQMKNEIEILETRENPNLLWI